MGLKRRPVAVLAIAAALLCLVGGSVVWKVERSLRRSLRESATADQVQVSVRALDGQPNPGFEALSAPAVFKSAAEFNNRLYLSGPAGLFVYSLDGILQHIYRVGPDLPAAPLGRMVVGTLADSRAPELLIATGGQGVLAFDGQHFRQILPGDAESRNVNALLPLSSGRLLLGTAKRGLLVYDGEMLKSFHPSTSSLYVTALAGTEAELWIGTLDRGVLDWRGGQVEAIGEPQGLPDARVDSLNVEDDAVYAGGPAGVAEIRAGKVVNVLARGSYAHVLQPDRGSLFVGQMEGGILRVGLSASASQSPRRAISARDTLQPDAKLRDIAESPVEQFLREGDALYAVTGSKLLRLDRGGEWQSILNAKDALLNDRNISSLMVASDGRIWVGYFDHGLDILPAAGGNPIHIENDQVFCVNRILENPRMSAVAVATANGLILFGRDGREKQVLTRDSGLIASHVTDVVLYGDGMVAGTPAGITFLDASGPHSIYAFQGLVNNHVYAVGARGNGLLVGTLGGLSLVSDGVVRRNLTTGNSGLKANWITALATAGDDWLAGTYGAGIVRMDANGAVTPTEATVEGTVVNPGAMIADGRMVFAGTLGKGLLVGDGTGTRWKTITAGLPSLNVTALAIDKGILYVGTDNGLVKIAEDKLL
jgi:ligand-binding sensor domain-containing protein